MQDETQRDEELRDGEDAAAEEETATSTTDDTATGDTSAAGDAGVNEGEVPEEETTEEAEAREGAGIATAEENAALEHSEGGATTRQDGTDAGVPMLPGDPSEPQGPEDALGTGEKRGDYEKRVGGQHAESVPVDGGGEPVEVDGEVVDRKPISRLVSQNERVAERGDVPGEKGGVTT